ncbi:MAG: hypothetical protein KDB23_04110 [Planctomycetales bacterium]|nr:hypothetical protein [Planctomycetales bacterium]
MTRKWLVVFLAQVLLTFSMVRTAESAKNVLMIADVNAAWHVDSEVELAEYLESVGYSVTIQHIGDMAGEAFAEEQRDLASQFDVVYLGDSIGSVTISQGDFEGSEFFMGELDVPIISQEAYMWDEALWVSRDRFFDFGDTFQAQEDGVLGAFTDMSIVAPNHPLAAGLSGDVSVYTDPYGFNFGFIPTMGKGVDVIATVPGQPEYATLFVYEKGSELVGGSTSPGMRIGMYLGQNVAPVDLDGDGTNNRFDRLTENGKQLIKAAFDYATGSGGILGDFDHDGLLTLADINSLSAAVRAASSDASFDLNGDSLVNNTDREVWVNDLKRTYFGDANLDGEFNSADFVAVFQSGQYEDSTPGNSDWSTGDWNGDADFDSSDFVAAFQAGGYENGPRAAVAAVPEPISGNLLLLGGLSLLRRARRKK